VLSCFAHAGPDGLLGQIFGPCAVPFSVEKQTLLREAMVAVMDSAFDVYTTLVSEVLTLRLTLCALKTRV
jgi:hypothetical protein